MSEAENKRFIRNVMDRNSDDEIELLENGKDGGEQNVYGSPESIYQNFPGFSVSTKAQVNPASLHALQTAFQGLHKQFIEQSKKLEEYQRKSAIMQRAIAEHGTNSISELEQILCANTGDIPNEAHASGAMTETSIAAESRARQGYQTYLERENLRKDTAMQKLHVENVALRKRLEQLENELRESLRERDSIHHDLECITHSFEEKTTEYNTLSRKLEELEKRLRTQDSDMSLYLKKDKEQEEIISHLQQQLEVYQKGSMGASEFQRKEEEYLRQIYVKDMQIGQLGLQYTRLEEDVQRLRMAGNESIPSGSDELDSDTRQLKEALDSVNWHKDMVRSLQDEVKQQQMYIKELMALVKGQRLKASESYPENVQNSFQPIIEDLTKLPSSLHQGAILFPPTIKDQLYVSNKPSTSQYNVRYAPDGKEPSPNEFKEHNVEVPDFIMNSASSPIRRTGSNKTDCYNIDHQAPGSREQTFTRGGAVGASSEQIKSSSNSQQIDLNRGINPIFPLKSDVKRTHSEGVLRMQEQPKSAVGNRTTVGESQKIPNYENLWRTPTTSPIQNTAGVPYNNLNHNSPTGITNPLNNSRYSPSPVYPKLPSPSYTSPRPQTSPVGTSQNVYVPLNVSQSNTRDPRPVTNASNSDSEKICPLCKTNFSYLTMDDFQAHVFECFDGDENNHTLAKPGPQVQTKSPSPSDDRTCPMCNAVFPNAIPQEEYERHVLEHFGEEPIIDRFEVLH